MNLYTIFMLLRYKAKFFFKHFNQYITNLVNIL